jgi:hypothetical protein
LKCRDIQRWREKLTNCNWLNIYEEIACKKLITCMKTIELRNLGRLLKKVKCKWGNPMKKIAWRVEYHNVNGMDHKVAGSGCVWLKT